MNIRRFQYAVVGRDDAFLALVAFLAGGVLGAGVHGNHAVAFGSTVALIAGSAGAGLGCRQPVDGADKQ